MSKVINGRSSIVGNIKGAWEKGESAYQIWLAEGNLGTRKQFLESLKAFSPVIGEMTQTEDGIEFTITDKNGEHPVTLRNGLDIKVESTEITEDGTLVTFNDGTNVLVGNGKKGDQGDPGREVIFQNIGDTLYWRYATDDLEWKQLADLNQIMESVYNSHPPFIYVDELPDPADAIEGVEYRLRQNGGD